MSIFVDILLILPLLLVIIFAAKMVIRIDWNIPVYKKVFIATMFLVAISFTLRAYIIYNRENYDLVLTLISFENFATLSVLPMLYWFEETITIEKKRLGLKNYLQAIPIAFIGVVVIVLMCILRQTHTAEEILRPQGVIERFSTEWWFKFFNNTLLDIVLIMQVLYTAAATIINIDRFRRDAKKYYAELCEDGYKHFLQILILIVLLVMLYSTKIFAKLYMTHSTALAVVFSILFALVVFHLFLCLNKIQFYADKVTETKEHLSIDGTDAVQQTSDPDLAKQFEAIEKALDKWSKDPSKPYLKQGVSLEDMSDEIGFSGKDVSTYLNRVLNQSFFIFIGSLRVEEAKRLLIAPENYSLTYIAFECGFSDAPNFSRSFKNIEGMTPGAWKFRNKK